MGLVASTPNVKQNQMKNFLLFIFLLIATTGCDDVNTAFTCPYTQQGDNILLADGTLARLAVVSDVRCPCNAACIWGGYIGMTITIGSDTILKVSDVFGHAFTTDTNFVNTLYYTSRGDRITLLDYTETDSNCDGATPGENFCLELSVE